MLATAPPGVAFLFMTRSQCRADRWISRATGRRQLPFPRADRPARFLRIEKAVSVVQQVTERLDEAQ